MEPIAKHTISPMPPYSEKPNREVSPGGKSRHRIDSGMALLAVLPISPYARPSYFDSVEM
jgi:hypothetical protein